MRITPDIAYDDSNPALALDLYVPESRAKGVILFAHGGGFHKGNRKNGFPHELAERWTHEGYALASAGYRTGTGLEDFPDQERGAIKRSTRKSGELGLPIARRLYGPAFEAARRDISKALDALRGLAHELGVDQPRPALLGVSAGGIAGLSLAFEPESARFPCRPSAVIALSAAIVQPWSLKDDGAPCLMLNACFDRIVPPAAAEAADHAARAAQAPVTVEICTRKGHNQTVEALLHDRNQHGATYFSRAMHLIENPR